MAVIKKFFFYGFALFALTSIIYGMAYDFMIGTEIHYDFYGAGFVAWLVFFGILKLRDTTVCKFITISVIIYLVENQI